MRGAISAPISAMRPFSIKRSPFEDSIGGIERNHCRITNEETLCHATPIIPVIADAPQNVTGASVKALFEGAIWSAATCRRFGVVSAALCFYRLISSASVHYLNQKRRQVAALQIALRMGLN